LFGKVHLPKARRTARFTCRTNAGLALNSSKMAPPRKIAAKAKAQKRKTEPAKSAAAKATANANKAKAKAKAVADVNPKANKGRSSDEIQNHPTEGASRAEPQPEAEAACTAYAPGAENDALVIGLADESELMPADPGDEETFTCSDCLVNKSMSQVYILRFASEAVVDDFGRGLGDGKGTETNIQRKRTGERPQEGDFFKCLPCHRLYSRAGRILKRLNLKSDWSDISKESRTGFMLKATNCFGSNLELMLNETITQFKMNKAVSSFDQNSQFLDEDDLNKEYKDKPSQLASIKMNAFKFECPVRKVWLWQNPSYTMNLREEEVTEETRKREISRDQRIRPEKKPKAQAKKKALPDGVNLKKADRARLTKMTQKLSEQAAYVPELKGRIDENVQKHVPQFAIDKVDVSVARLNQYVTDIDLSMSADESIPDLKGMLDVCGKSISASKAVNATLESFIEEALAHINEKASEQ
jgi:hypothetical protein